ncbi:xanthine dehydrogenase family protein molybdopterin-binding subunit [Ensifer sp. MPMI2T]|nr:xanthine dehydrogenase family protein molybdopterin-binding subunit [Ensifer sp. MPMI2T]
MTYHKPNLSRRAFLATSGALSVAVLGGGLVSVFRDAAEAQDLGRSEINAWVSIARNGRVAIRYTSGEMGQGVSTSLPLVLAEELDADWSMVDALQVDQGPPATFGNPLINNILYTAGSLSIAGYFDRMRRAGATARRVLVHSAAASWRVPVGEVTTEPGFVVHGRSRRRMSFGEVVALPQLVTDVPAITDADLKPREQWRLIGSDVGRLDVPEKARGAITYSIDVRLPGMVYAAQLLAPVEGETPTVTTDTDARAVPGVVDIIPLRNAVAVVAETWEAALAARELLKVEWSNTSPFRSTDSAAELKELAAAAADPAREAFPWETRGDARAALRSSARVISADYSTEYVYHAQMEPLAAVAAVDADGKGAEVWLGTQSQTVSIGIAAAVLQTTPDRIRFHAMQMGGGFGRRTFFARDLLRDALLISKQLKRPVKLMWTREDDVKNGWFRPATAHRLEAALDSNGDVTAWRHRVVSASILAFAMPDNWAKANNRDFLVMEGAESADYAIPNLIAEHVIADRRTRVAAWRGIGWGPNMFARECFIDELAAAANADPVAFRRRLLRNNERGLRVLDAVVAISKFGTAPQGRAHGLSFAGYKETRAAGVAEVSVDGEGRVRVHRFWAAVDPGVAVHPNNLLAQVEGGIIFGLSGLLQERITIAGGEVQQSNFYDYEPLRIGDIPQIEVQIVESGAAPTGAGEIGVPMTGAAVANAIFALTGRRQRQMPFGQVRS